MSIYRFEDSQYNIEWGKQYDYCTACGDMHRRSDPCTPNTDDEADKDAYIECLLQEEETFEERLQTGFAFLDPEEQED